MFSDKHSENSFTYWPWAWYLVQNMTSLEIGQNYKGEGHKDRVIGQRDIVNEILSWSVLWNFNDSSLHLEIEDKLMYRNSYLEDEI